MESLKKQSSVLKTPKPYVTFEDFGDSALLFHLNFYINDSFRVPRLRSEVRFTIDRIFRENNITIPLGLYFLSLSTSDVVYETAMIISY